MPEITGQLTRDSLDPQVQEWLSETALAKFEKLGKDLHTFFSPHRGDLQGVTSYVYMAFTAIMLLMLFSGKVSIHDNFLIIIILV